MTWLITGGAGYIGAHVVRALTEAGEQAVVYDDLSTGVAERVPADVPLVTGSTLDAERVAHTLADHEVTGVVHLAAKKQVGESVDLPLHYYRENVEGLRVLLEAVTAADVPSFVFSSSAAVYGMPDVDLVTEETPCAPMSPYGETKLAGEWLVRATGKATGLATASLRYFNVAGAATPELADTGVFNLIPMVFEKLTENAPPRIFGDDYPTPDGTCVRDYIHVADLAEAHLLAVQAAAPGEHLICNLGNGNGFSVRQVIETVRQVTGHPVPEVVAPRRGGDPAVLVASADTAREKLGWNPTRADLAGIVADAWEFAQSITKEH